MTKLSTWIVVDGYCAMRIIEHANPDDISMRVAFIEKTPRIRISPFTNSSTDHINWSQGPKGSGCSAGDEEREQAYGFDPESRAWCDMMLMAAGYDVPEPVILP